MSSAPPEIAPNGEFAAGTTVRDTLAETFARLDAWCSLPEERLLQRPAYPAAWSAAEHLEHVSLANHFLLLTIGKGVAAALRRARNRPIPTGESNLARLAPIADPAAFPWEPPGHMIPTGTAQVSEVRALLTGQLGECLELLERMGNGEGRLCSFRMSVNKLGRLDMYQWLYFLALHGRWHLEFLARRERNG
ncbi:MAG TPA: DinB family protein [Dongiaceae bacterium]|nr:DinB family protein [Dongiaceae bacterium]